MTIVWFRADLRLSDNPALSAAIARGGPVLPVFIWDPTGEGRWAPGAASRWWLHHSLNSLSVDLAGRRSRLIVRMGPSLSVLQELIAQTGATAIFWNRRYEPAALARDQKIEQTLKKMGLTIETFNASLLAEPWTVQTQSAKPYQMFTPFWNACLNQLEPGSLLPPPTTIPSFPTTIRSSSIEELKLKPLIPWDSGLSKMWCPGESGAQRQLEQFVGDALGNYSQGRDLPATLGSSRLSPYLHFGEIGPRQILEAVQARTLQGRLPGIFGSSDVYLKEIGWREFAYHLLYHFPHTPENPLRAEFKAFPWIKDARGLKAWQRGQTGYPLVDAGMRELWNTGWMHNRVRMVASSFLVKDLLIDWRAGANWFWDTLVDADLANNTLGWQWTAGCGADAAPYFRILNPLSQGERFDASGDYVRRWVPELGRLPNGWVHKPSEAPPAILTTAGVTLGKTYPRPIVSHAEVRRRALDAVASIRK